MYFKIGDLVNLYCYKNNYFFFEEKIKIIDRKETYACVYYYYLDPTNLRLQRDGYGCRGLINNWTVGENLVPSNHYPSIESLTKMLLDQNNQIREEASRVYEVVKNLDQSKIKFFKIEL